MVVNQELFTVDGLIPNEILTKLKDYGVVVINNVYSQKVCKDFVLDYIPKCEDVLDQIFTVKPGQYKDIICHYESIWKFRTDEKLSALFSYLYKNLHEYDNYPNVIPSIDGVNIKSSSKAPFYDKTQKDWAHLDQTNGNLFECIQGQIVFTDSTGGFVCSPKSHLKFKEIMTIMNVDPKDKSNWLMISRKASKEQEQAIIELIESIEGSYQQYIKASPGTVILWLSTTIHSARTADLVKIKKVKIL